MINPEGSLGRLLGRFVGSDLSKKFVKYAVGSGVSAVVSYVALILSYGVFHLFEARGSAIFATLVGAVPSYFLNRNWAWQKRDRSSLSKEVVPYLIMAIIGLVFSTWSTDFASSHSSIAGPPHSSAAVLFVSGAYIGSFAVLWFAKFAFLNRFLFASAIEPNVEALKPNIAD